MNTYLYFYCHNESTLGNLSPAVVPVHFATHRQSIRQTYNR